VPTSIVREIESDDDLEGSKRMGTRRYIFYVVFENLEDVVGCCWKCLPIIGIPGPSTIDTRDLPFHVVTVLE
jgi:hypothetical protein